MERFKNNYLPNPEDWTKWDASPIFASEEMLKGLPPAHIAVCELDILCDEGLAYAEKLRKAGVSVEVKVYKGAPHPILAMDGEWVHTMRLLMLMDRRRYFGCFYIYPG